MKTLSAALKVMTCAVLLMTLTSIAQAQATRTWVSGVGADDNPCSRTAPCKTFAGAISKTASGGEISVLDPGGYGAVTIGKPLTIEGSQGAGYGSILAGGISGTYGVTINSPGANDVVTLRNLSINGATTGLIGVRILAAKSVIIENCVIFKFRASSAGNGRGISDQRSVAGGKLLVQNTTINDNLSNAIVTNTAAINMVLNNVRVHDNGQSGVYAGMGAKVTIRDSVLTGNGNAGVQAADANTEVYISDSVLSHNTSYGVYAGSGASVVRLSNVTIGENGTGVLAMGGTIETYGNNNVRGNGAGNTLPASLGQQ
ncbi:MAG TPA: right-handed parallel beta-helix repeat-containing protein [Pyrinomonadaceae bacterium]|nr:right-handed parallel beta-helix repeat-containing protein [Pyrinomonadaceae bacterium]